MPTDGHRLGQRRDIRREAIRHRHHERFVHKQLLGVGAGGIHRETNHVHLLVALQQRQRHHMGSGRIGSPAARPVLGDLAAELVPEHDAAIGAHEVVVADLVEHVGELVGVVAGVQVGSANPAAQHSERHLSSLRMRRRYIGQLQLGLVAGNRLHQITLLCLSGRLTAT